ncbi:MAG TPA: type II toxin-antitoxin system death-on-curing family toxin, partial [Gaiellaceae bacterium]|nr:type II toxin-antitoxin system death-on-curing family toxin [Gaiellaceae bacterium]
MTVAELATRADLDVDETLILLWDVGLERYTQPGDKLKRRDLATAESVIGLPKKRDLLDPTHWADKLRLEMPALHDLLTELGTPMNPRAKTLPRGAVAKLSRHAARQPPAPPVVAPAASSKAAPAAVEVALGEWRIVGQPRALRLLTETEVEAIHWELVADFSRDADPIDPPGVRNPDLLASAVFRQHTAMGREAKYPTVEMAASALFHALVHDHPFHNGNKRTGLVSMLVFLDENGFMIHDSCDEDEL